MRVSPAVLVLVFHFLFVAFASPPPSVIIVGAGTSGIAAAKSLHDAGIQDILILEASPRIGGRIWKTQFRGLTMEMGASWLFGGGPKLNPLLDMAVSKLKLKTTISDFGHISSNTYKQEGGLYPKQIVDAELQAVGARASFFANFSAYLSSKSGKDDDVSILAAERLYKMVPSTPFELVIDYYTNDYFDAESPKVTSLKKYPRNELADHGGVAYFTADPRGLESVVHQMAAEFLSSLEDPRLKLNKVVREISYCKGGVTVKTEDGSLYQAKYAIVSPSLGVLQSDLIQFKPELPLWKRVAIADFSMTIYTKIFLKFPHKFWPTGPGTEFFLYAHEKSGYYPVWKHMENAIPGSNILFVTVTGEESKRIEEQSDEKTKAEAMEVLRKLFGSNIPDPEAIFVPRWLSNRFYKGSYANWPSRYTQKRHQHLKDPVGPVYFTGEHTSSKYMGFISGAYYAGIETANDLMNCIKSKACKGQLHASG